MRRSNAKARLIMLYFIAKRRIDKEEEKKLIQYANLNSQDAQAVQNLEHFGIPLSDSGGLAEEAKSLKKSKPKIKKSKDSEVSYALSRYTPPLKAIIEVSMACFMGCTVMCVCASIFSCRTFVQISCLV